MTAQDVDYNRRQFLWIASGALTGMGLLWATWPFVASWLPSAKVQAANLPVEYNLSQLQPGQLAVISWRGKPVWIIRRSEEMLKQLAQYEQQLRDPDSLVDQQPSYAKNRYRSRHPDYLILIGLCTHLGCSPKYKKNGEDLPAGLEIGFYCPCHGSVFDLAGRVFKGVPAPVNLQVPPHTFIDEHRVLIGVDDVAEV